MNGVVGICDYDAHPVCPCGPIRNCISDERTRASVSNPGATSRFTSILLRNRVKVKVHIVITGYQLNEFKGFVFNDIAVLIVNRDVVNPGKHYTWRDSWG